MEKLLVAGAQTRVFGPPERRPRAPLSGRRGFLGWPEKWRQSLAPRRPSQLQGYPATGSLLRGEIRRREALEASAIWLSQAAGRHIPFRTHRPRRCAFG